MYRLFQPIAPGIPRIVGPASGDYIGPPGPNFTTQQWIIPWKSLPQDKDPKFSKKMAPVIRRLNFPKIKAQRARPRPPRSETAIAKPLKIGNGVREHGNPHGLKLIDAFDALKCSPCYLQRNEFGNGTKKLSGAQTRMPYLKAGNKALAGLEHALMAESEQLAE
ncbi:hypothetical protein SUGI_0882470 [Cryptomeria japonica]|uniref:uncharacterized protein LOC131074329 n=1 Tax=Cryptomeria japonica TaxID=3369 RepID=UPI0024149EF5|nr:uncharacterized protein LOC131074329 [Cryptomeria japonica]GLJ42569.1 hypothetical protein SUGI_0882470 [Cryptomeria japonica]